MLLIACTLQAYPKIYINEISGNEKWLEIYNDADESVDLAGYTIRKIDENNEPSDFYLKSGTVIEGKGFLYWTRDKNNTDGSTFTWGISAKKDVAFKIFDTEAKEIDYFEVRSDLYSEGLNRTVGRETDGAEKLVIFTDGGTKGTSNNEGNIQTPTPDPKKIYVNEINGNKLNKEGENQPKWLEIYNAEEEDVDISNYIIQKIDEKGSIDNWFIPANTTIEGKGFKVWEQDSLCTDGSTFTWGISARKNVAFKIFDNNGTLLDHFEVNIETGGLYSEGEGRTVGRETDGAEKLVIFENNGTKGTSNKENQGPVDPDPGPIDPDPTDPDPEPTDPEPTDPDTGNSLYEDQVSIPFAYVKSKTIFLSEQVKSFTLFGVSGKAYLSQDQVNDMEINANELPDGIYLLQMFDVDNIPTVQKIYIK